MTSSQDEFLSPEETIPTTGHAIADELPPSIRRFDKDISCHWKDRYYVDPTKATPQDATDYMANRIHGYNLEDDRLTQDELLHAFRYDFKDWPFELFNSANTGVRLCLRNFLQKHGIEAKKGSGNSVPKILHDIAKFGKADPIVPASPIRVPASPIRVPTSPIRPPTPTNPATEAEPAQTIQLMILQTIQQIQQQSQQAMQQMQQKQEESQQDRRHKYLHRPRLNTNIGTTLE
ncbi:hypothetical protein E4U22_004266 [Claviceps purpurea]|nr:hypothetical protein E4U22_004266 [Claviceps purpurea]